MQVFEALSKRPTSESHTKQTDVMIVNIALVMSADWSLRVWSHRAGLSQIQPYIFVCSASETWPKK